MKNGIRLALLAGCVLLGSATLWAKPPHIENRSARFAVFSDPHYYDAQLGTTGAAFEAYLASDRKMLRESEAILDATVRALLKEKIQFVLVPGDLTKDGELLCHHDFAQKMKELEKSGIEVYVIPGNHDINNPHAYAYSGDSAIPVENVSAEKFAKIYKKFGYDQALARDPNSLSYVFEPVPGFWVLALDSTIHDQNQSLGYPVTAGRLSRETLVWASAQLEQARKLGNQVTAMMHHGVVEHFLGQSQLFPEYVIENWPSVSLDLAGAGLTTIFTGHFHAQDVTFGPVIPNSQIAPAIFDIETGSLVSYPSPYRVVTWNRDGSMQIQSKFIQEIDYDTAGLPFQEYAAAFLREGLQGLVMSELTAGFGLDAGTAAWIAPALVEGFVAHYAGDEHLTDPLIAGKIQYLLSQPVGSTAYSLGLSIHFLWNDLPPGDNNLVVP